MKKPYRLIALDVDGTLLNDHHELTEGVKEAVRQAAETGARIMLCTGRGPSQSFHILEELGLSGLLVTHNGAATVRSEDRELVHGFSYAMRDLQTVIDYCRSRGLQFDVNSVFDLYAEAISEDARVMYDAFNVVPLLVPDLMKVEHPIFKMTVFGPVDEMDRLMEKWPEMESGLTALRSHDRFVDVIHPDASKGNALKQLAEKEGITREEILAIGNYYNDITMLRYAGLGVAMGNSPQEVLEAADEVGPTNNEDGVRAVLLKHVIGAE